MSKHTPGPWQVGLAPVSRTLVVWGKGGTTWICGRFVADNATAIPMSEAEANAHLVAAAPEMLAALKRQQANIRRWLETGIPADADESKSISNQIDAAIAKAEGQS